MLIKRLICNLHIRLYISALLCVCVAGCSSDSTVNDVDEPQLQVPMQFSQAAITSAVTRAGSSNALTTGFLVGCFKGLGEGIYNNPQVVMDNYEVLYSSNAWAGVSKWDYVGTTSNGYYKKQVQRYWDTSAFPYQFYAVSPCPSHTDISGFVLTNTTFSMPVSAKYSYQTCNNGVVSGGLDPYNIAQVQCSDVDNTHDKDLINGNTIVKSGATTSYDRYVALPFHHLTSIVRFLLYNNYKKELPATLTLTNLQIKAASDNFVMAGDSYTADLTKTDMLHGSFTNPTYANDAQKVLLQTDATKICDMKVAVDRDHAYNCENPAGLLQIPQQNVKLTISFDVIGVKYKEDFTNTTNGGKITYTKATETVHYENVPIGDSNGLVSWAPNTIYTYVIKVNEFYPLSIDFTAELTPWSNVEGTINTNLEQ